MTIMNSLSTAFILMVIVFIVLAGLFTFLKLQTSILANFKGKENQPVMNNQVEIKAAPVQRPVEASYGELELIGVDERTAAMVMAVASDELKIPLNELHFKSIRALD